MNRNESLPSSLENESSSLLRKRVEKTVARIAIVSTATLALTIGSNAINSSEAEALPGYHVTGAEKAWCRWPSRWSICFGARELSNQAADEAYRVSQETGWSLSDGGADAVRHCYWNSLMTLRYGEDTAEGLATRHEYDDTQTPEQQQMDLHNNQTGRNYAYADNPLQDCINGVNSGELVRLVN